jgi:hypothetical protein
MRRSMLELYLDILKVLAHQGPLKVTHVIKVVARKPVAFRYGVNCVALIVRQLLTIKYVQNY